MGQNNRLLYRMWKRDFLIFRSRGVSYNKAVTMASQNSYWVGRGMPVWTVLIPRIGAWADGAKRRVFARGFVRGIIERILNAPSTPRMTPAVRRYDTPQ